MRRVLDRRGKGPEAPRPRAPSGLRHFGSPILLILLWSLDPEKPKPQCAFEPIFLIVF